METNKDIELIEAERKRITSIAESAFKMLTNEILTPTLGEGKKTFKDGYIEMHESFQARIIFLEKECKAWMDRAIKSQIGK